MTTVFDASTERLREVARSGGISLVGSAASSLLGFGLVVLVSRGLGPGGAGAFAVAVAVAMTLTVAGRFGTDTALVRTLPRLRELGRDADVRVAVRAALAPVCVGATLLGAALWLLAPRAATHLLADANADEGTWLLRVAAVVVPLGAGGFVALSATRALGTIVPLTVIESIVKPAGRLVLVGAVLLVGASALGAMIAWTVAAAVGAALSFAALRRSLRSLRGLRPRGDRRAQDPRGARRDLWAFAGPRAVAALCEIGGLHVGLILTSALAGTEQAGIFNAVLRLALAGMLAMQALRLAMAPRISRMLTAGDVDGVEHVHQASTTWVVLLSFPVYLLFAGWPSELLSLFGDEFRAGAPALAVLAVAMLLNLATGNVATVLLMSGRSGLTLVITASSFALAIGLTLLLAPAYGALGAALAKGASVVFENVAVAVAVRNRIGVRPLSRPLAVAAGLAIACFAVPTLGAQVLDHAGVTSVTGSVAAAMTLAGATVYAIAVWRLRRPFELAALGAAMPGRLSRRVQPTTTKGASQ